MLKIQSSAPCQFLGVITIQERPLLARVGYKMQCVYSVVVNTTTKVELLKTKTGKVTT